MTCEWQNGTTGFLLRHIACPYNKTDAQMVTTHGGDRLVDAPMCLRQARQYDKCNGCVFRKVQEL